ncbi:MAG: hypothetical protein IRY85_19830 [Micromonosporaceae bacterium]|nr:hypothetical protein [Micromonosporaceae bacterium]
MSDHVPGVERADPSLSAAVLIGVGQYRSDFPPVPQAETCVRRLAEEFAAPDLWGLRRHVGSIELVNPDRATVLEAVGRAAQVVRSPGILVIYFVGHAERFGDQLCLATADGDRSRPDKTMVTVADLADEVSRNGRPGTATMLLLDCCYAGHAARSLPATAVRAAESAGWYLIGAADRHSPADAAPGDETTRFTGALLEVLQGVPGKGRSLCGRDIFTALTEKLPDNPPVHCETSAGSHPWMVNRRYDPPVAAAPSGSGGPPRRPRMVPPIPPGLVDRPDLRRALIKSLRDSAEKSVVVNAVWGAGGFGKTTLVIQTCHDPAIDELFPGGVLWTELGQDIEGADLASKINDLTEQLTGTRPTLSGPQEAGFRLGEALDACPQPILLVVDDVWRDEQIQPFLLGGQRCRRLVTTRVKLPSLAAATPVPIDRMSDDEAEAVITRDLSGLPDDLIARLLRLTGRWPLLLNITNRTIARLAAARRPVADAARIVADRLGQAGPAALDDPVTFTSQHRTQLVAACLNASLDELPAFARDRYLELGIFAEDTDIPYTALALLWGESGGLDRFQTEQLGLALIDASLATPARHQPGLRLHDVLRSYLREAVGPDRRTRVNAHLITAASRLLPEDNNGGRPWWTLPPEQDYLWHHLVDHLIGAGLHAEVDTLVVDLRWIAARVRRSGPVRAEADLARSRHPDAAVLSQAIRHNAHLLAPVKPDQAIDDILASRLDGNPQLQPRVAAFTRTLTHRPRLANRWPPPDQPDPALRRAIHTGHPYGIDRLYIAPDGTWLATTGNGRDATVRIWDTTTGTQRHHIDTGHPHDVDQLDLAQNGTFLVAVGDTSMVVWTPEAQDVAVLRVDGAIGHVVLSTVENAVFVGGTRGLYGFDVLLD